MADRVSAAMRQVHRDLYWQDSNGSIIYQITKPEVIARMLRLLAVAKGIRVFEVGTGSGHSTALLSVLVGAHGQVISVDVDPEMVYRATGLLQATAGRTCECFSPMAGRDTQQQLRMTA
jgi:protein-L-isoaspartate O-methyltransferase